MANITLAGTLRDPNGDLAVGDKIRFTHKSTTGETVKSASSILTIDPTGVYSVDLEYGLILVEYKDARNSQFGNLGVATVNGDNPATTIPELLNALVPVSSAELIEFQVILADCVAAKDAAEAAAATLDLIADLSQSYIFDTVALMASSLIVFPINKPLRVLDSDILYKVAAGASPDNSTSPDLQGAYYAARQEQSIISADEYATFDSDVVSGATSLSHTAGSIEIVDATIAVLADTYYRVTVDITTTTSGFVKVFFGNDTIPGNQVEAIYGDQPNGFFFSTAAIFADGTENNRVLTTNIYTFPLYTSATAFSNLHIETDALWGGSIGSITIQKVNEKPAYNKVIPSDGVGRDYYLGMKGGSVNKNDIALGDKSSLGMFQYDAISPTPAHNVSFGNKTLAANQHGDENSAGGTFSGMSQEGSNGTYWGYSAFKLCTKGQENTGSGYKVAPFLTTGSRNTFDGFWAGAGVRTGNDGCDYGWRPNVDSGDKTSFSYFGSRCGTGIFGGLSNSLFGANAARTTIGTPTIDVDFISGFGAECKPWGNGAVTIGFQSKAGDEALLADNAVAIGRGANAKNTGAVAIGFNASTNSTSGIAIGDVALSGADGAISIGDGASANASRSISIGPASSANGVQSTVVGSLSTPTGGNATTHGFRAANNMTGSGVTAIGHTAGLQAINAFDNVTLLGQLTAVTGSNQVQLGDSSTTTYAYGAVQDRSDIRDKLDVKDLTDDHIAFFMDIEWKQYRMNHRERYNGTENDGSLAGTRFHVGAIAQQVESAMKKHKIDFAGLQHHSIGGGQDVYTIGYQEFIGIQGLIIQRQQSRLLSIEDRLAKAGI